MSLPAVSLRQLQQLSTQVRRDILRMVTKAKSGHVGGPLGCTEYFVALYYALMTHNPQETTSQEQDVFFLSNGHCCAVWYSVLARKGYFPIKELGTFRKLGSRLQGHPSCCDGLPGIRIASGSLGQGLSVAVGAAQAKKLLSDKHLVYVLMGDGEQQEGQIWEAAMYAAHHQVDNIIATIDYNQQQIDGPTDTVIGLGNLRSKYESFGWQVIEGNGNDMTEVINSLQAARALTRKGRPILYLMHTVMGQGVSFMQNDYRWHGTPPTEEQCTQALEALEETIGDF